MVELDGDIEANTATMTDLVPSRRVPIPAHPERAPVSRFGYLFERSIFFTRLFRLRCNFQQLIVLST